MTSTFAILAWLGPIPAALGLHDTSDFQSLAPRVAQVGDLDRDGVDDLVVASGDSCTVRPWQAEVQVISGATGCRIWSVSSGVDDAAAYGRALSNAGDLDLDGCSDVAFSVSKTARLPFRSAAFHGWVEVRSGRTSELMLRIPAKGYVGGVFGQSIAGGRDFDGDGVPDIAISAPLEPAACVRVFSGVDGAELARWSSAQLDTMRSLPWSPKEPSDELRPASEDPSARWGEEISWVAAVGAPARADVAVVANGTALALGRDGTWRASTASHLYNGPIEVSDLNGDSVRDLMCGYVALDGVDLSLMFRSSQDPVFPWSPMLYRPSAAGLDDVDGDGLADYIRAEAAILVPGGWAAVRSTRSDRVLWMVTDVISMRTAASIPIGAEAHSFSGGWDDSEGREGYQCASLSDVDGDGMRDFVTYDVDSRALIARSGQLPSRVLWSR